MCVEARNVRECEVATIGPSLAQSASAKRAQTVRNMGRTRIAGRDLRENALFGPNKFFFCRKNRIFATIMDASLLQTILFWVFSIIGIGGALGLIFNHNTIYAALSLVLNFFSIAGLYLSLNAEFLAIIQIFVYAGAIMVLFIFVIMLLNLQSEKTAWRFDFARGAAFITGLAFTAEMIAVLKHFHAQKVGGAFVYGHVEPIGRALMTDYLFPFEMISVVLLAALVGAIMVAKKHTYEQE